MTIPEPVAASSVKPPQQPWQFWAIVGGVSAASLLVTGAVYYFAFGGGRSDDSAPPPQSPMAMASATARIGSALELQVIKLRLQEILGDAAVADHARTVTDAANAYATEQPPPDAIETLRSDVGALAKRLFETVRQKISTATWPADKDAVYYSEFAGLKLSGAHRNFVYAHITDGDRTGPLRDAVDVLLLTEGKIQGADALLPDVYAETREALRDAVAGGTAPSVPQQAPSQPANNAAPPTALEPVAPPAPAPAATTPPPAPSTATIRKSPERTPPPRKQPEALPDVAPTNNGNAGNAGNAGDVLFPVPNMYGANVDWCAGWAVGCGQPGADQFCRTQGYTRATRWSWGYVDRSYVIGSNQFCEARGQCGALKDVVCEP